MLAVGKIFCFVLFILSIYHARGQDVYSISSETEDDCSTTQFYNFNTLRCEECAVNRTQSSNDKTFCLCNTGFRMNILDPRSLVCTECPTGQVPTTDGYSCTSCSNSTGAAGTCTCLAKNALVQYLPNGNNSGTSDCTACSVTSTPTPFQRCVPCPECCSGNTNNIVGRLCFTQTQKQDIDAQNIAASGDISDFYNTENIKAAYGACQLVGDVNQTACEQLCNMCVMENYAIVSGAISKNACGAYQSIYIARQSILGRLDWKDQLPWIRYSNPDNVLIDTSIAAQFNFNGESIPFVIAKYRANGTFMGLSDVTDGLLQLCKDTPNKMNAAYIFGTSYRAFCTFDANLLWEDEGSNNIFFELYLNDSLTLYPVPIRIVGLERTSTGVNQYFRRFYIIDNVRNKVGDSLATTVYYAKSMTIAFNIQTSTNPAGRIFPPLLTIEYASVDATILEIESPSVVASFAVTYQVSMQNFEEFLQIVLPLFGSLAILYSLLETSGWRRREGIQILDFSSLIQLLLSLCGNLGNVFFAIMFIYCTVILIFFKLQVSATFYVPTADQETLFVIFVSLAFGLKTVHILTLILRQCSIDIFLLDWEKPKPKSQGQENKVSVWRTFFVANEWHEIETVRKTNPVLQLFCLVFFLKVVKLEQLALMDHSSDLERAADSFVPEYSSVLRFSVGSFTYILIALVQVIYFIAIHERFFEDQMRQFVDLCSVANMSVFVLSHRHFGYYIHGRSVHGKADTDMVDMTKMLKREEDNIVGRRGLVPESDIQTFDMQIPPKMRLQFDKIYEPLRLLRTQPSARSAAASLKELEAAESAKAYNIMRNFLTAFLDHSLRDLDYIVKDKLFLEKVLNMEFREPYDKGYLNNDESGCSFCDVLFYGHETAFLVFEILIFTITDYLSQDFVVSAIVTYLVYMVLVKVRVLLSGYNITKKTLVDGRFLI